ncbi:MAG: beta-ketoacyl-ACP synthase II [Treponema sp.]|nr:beta-ketoacyl-ACP synthase II [Treponema sp.]
MSLRRVVVTGLGVISPVGNSVDEAWESIKNGKSGIGPITLFDASNQQSQVAGEVKNFDITKYGIEHRATRKMARFTQFLLAASAQAVSDAGYTKESLQKEKAGLMIGNCIGGLDVLEESFKKYCASGPSRIPPLTAPMFITNEAAANVSMFFGLNGLSWTLGTACASGTDALGAGLDLIRSGRLDVCIAGGTEALVNGFGIGVFSALQALSTHYNNTPQKASRPFDKDRDGFVLAEGSAVLILEELEHAKARGAHIYAELAGFGASCDAHHITAPIADGSIAANAVAGALADAGLKPEDIQYYNAHGTSTHANDESETKMLKKVFGDHAYKMKVSSTKSMTGHLVGAAGAIEAIFTIKAIQDGFFPPTINLDNPDVEAGCDLDYVPNKGVSGTINAAASASLGFGGHNGCIVIRRFKDADA